MVYRVMGLVHAWVTAAWSGERAMALRHGERGQGTVEYVALILLVAALLAGVVTATKGTRFGTGGIANAIVRQIREALEGLR